MKTPKEVINLNYNDVSFLKGIKISEAKFLIYKYLVKDSVSNLEDDGKIKMSTNETIPKKAIETKIKSSTVLDGKNYIDTIITHYNNGTTKHKLKKLSDVFYRKIKFTGKYSLLNDILNDGQLVLLQKNSVLRNTFYNQIFSKDTCKFIHDNEWIIEHLTNNGVSIDKVNDNINEYKANLKTNKK